MTDDRARRSEPKVRLVRRLQSPLAQARVKRLMGRIRELEQELEAGRNQRQEAEATWNRLQAELQAKAEARTQELLDLYEHAPCGFHSLALDGTILRTNQAELAMLGYAEHEFVGHRITEFMTPESLAHFRTIFPGFLQTGRVRDLEFDLVCKDGEVLPILVTGTGCSRPSWAIRRNWPSGSLCVSPTWSASTASGGIIPARSTRRSWPGSSI
jgi:PAS domain S-box-containing protein